MAEPLFEELKQKFDYFVHHHDARGSVTINPTAGAAGTTQGAPVTIAADVKQDLTEGAEWVGQWFGRVQTALPSLIATAESISGSTVGALVEAVGGAVLPPAYEKVAVDFVTDLVNKYGQPAATAATATTVAPVQAGPVVAGQA